MDIYVGKLPDFATIIELKKFFKGYDKQARFDLRRCKGKDGSQITYGFVSIASERLANKAVKRLHMKKFMGTSVSVREYEHRASGNDRRQLGWRKKLWLGEERRQIDRREAKVVKSRGMDSRAA
jgi:RNA recognition motif-containing protein